MTWLLVRRLRRGVEEDLALPLEARMLDAELRATAERGVPPPRDWSRRALRLYARLEAAGLHEQARDLAKGAAQAQDAISSRKGKE